MPENELPSSTDVTRELSRQRLVDDDDRSGGLTALIGDRFDKIAALVRPLAAVRLDATRHHAATLLDVALLSFKYVEQRRPFDEELLTASLLVEAGRVIDRRRAIEAILNAAAGLVTPRTVWLIEMRNTAIAYSDGTLGHRARHRLVAHADFDDVMLLALSVTICTTESEVPQQPHQETPDLFHRFLQLVPPRPGASHHQNLHEQQDDASPYERSIRISNRSIPHFNQPHRPWRHKTSCSIQYCLDCSSTINHPTGFYKQ